VEEQREIVLLNLHYGISAEEAWTRRPAWEIDLLLDVLPESLPDEGWVEGEMGDDAGVEAAPAAPRRLRPSSFARLADQHERNRR
jgi:hypothetical protein